MEIKSPAGRDVAIAAAHAPAEAVRPVQAPAATARTPESIAVPAAPLQAPRQRKVDISVDEETGRTLVRLLDAETGDIVRQVPAEESLALARAIGQLQHGRLETKA